MESYTARNSYDFVNYRSACSQCGGMKGVEYLGLREVPGEDWWCGKKGLVWQMECKDVMRMMPESKLDCQCFYSDDAYGPSHS